MKKEIISKLYEIFMDDIYKKTMENSKLVENVEKEEENFIKTLTDEQKLMYEKFVDASNVKNEELYKNIFEFAYSLATKLIFEGLDNEKEKT